MWHLLHWFTGLLTSSHNVCFLCAIGPQLYSVPMVIFAPGLAECSLASKAPLPIAPHAVLMLLTSCLTSYSPCCRDILHARAWLLVVISLFGGPTSVSLRASPGMVRGVTIIGILQIPFCTLDSERLVWHSIEQCARPVARSGRNGNLVSHHSLSLSLDWQLPSSATLSVAQLIRVATNQIK